VVERLPSECEALSSNPYQDLCVCVCVCVVLGFELRAYTMSHSTSLFFVKGFFKIGSHKLFSGAGFKQQY
jgi:hypothetical protein